MDTKRSVLAVLVAAVLLSSMVGMASAVSQNWYMTDTDPSVSGANYLMHKDSGEGIIPVPINAGQSKVWVADEYVTVNQIDMSGTWNVNLTVLNVGAPGTAKFKVDIGTLSGGSFTSKGNADITPYYLGVFETKLFTMNIDTTDHTIGENDYLAIQVTDYTGYINIQVLTVGEVNSPSYIASPSTDPGYPFPELPTVLLTSIGLLALTGFVLFSRVEKRKR
jgi:hypothetical protein